MVKADEESEGTVPAETNGSNGFYRAQTFAQNSLARDYGIPSDKIRWPETMECFTYSPRLEENLRAPCLQKPRGVMNFTESRPSHRIAMPESMEFLTFVHRLEEIIEGTVHAETNRSNEFYKI